jgi:hypothetical protein
VCFYFSWRKKKKICEKKKFKIQNIKKKDSSTLNYKKKQTQNMSDEEEQLRFFIYLFISFLIPVFVFTWTLAFFFSQATHDWYRIVTCCNYVVGLGTGLPSGEVGH